jgi:hypothetical protein
MRRPFGAPPVAAPGMQPRGMLPQGTPQPGQFMPQPGQFMPQPMPQPGALPGQRGMLGLPMQGQPQQPPGAATPEQAAQERFDAMQRAGQPTTTSGLFEPTALPAQRVQPGQGNVFAGGADWFPGLFDTTKRQTPFDSFYTSNARSDYNL